MDQSNFADQFVSGLLNWVRWIGEKIAGLFQNQGTSGTSSGGSALFRWFTDNWIGLLIVLVVAGILLDWIVWMVRWRPYWLWFGKKRVLYDDDIDIDLSDEELERRFGPMEPRIESREHFRASQLGRAGRPMYGDDEDIDYMMEHEPVRPAAREDDGYDDGPDVEDPYEGYAESAYRQQADARHAKYQRQRFEVVDEDDAFDELYDDEDEDDYDDELYGDEDDYDDELYCKEDDYNEELYGNEDEEYIEYEDDEDAEEDDDYEDAPRVRRGLKLGGRFSTRKADAARGAKRERAPQNTAFVSASRGGRRTGSDLIQSQKPAKEERAGTHTDPSDDPFSVDGLIDDEDDGFLDVVSSMAESPLPPVSHLPKNMPNPERGVEIASEFAPDSVKPLGDWRTGYSGVYDAVHAPNVDELESALEELEASSRRARRRARDQENVVLDGVDEEPIEGKFEDE